jgi:ABC-2 type transport system ATP-binding protein
MNMNALEITNLKKVYPKGLEALKGINLSVRQGDFFGLLGPNGAGKSTAIGIICSLVKKTSGQVSILGHDLDNEPEKAKRNLGLVPQEFNFNGFEKVINIIMNQAGFYGIPYKQAKENAEFFLKKLELSSKADTPARFLSGGMKRRLMIARGLVHHPKLLILDEPTAGVDIEARRFTWDFLKEINQQGTTIILTTHYLEEAENLCNQVAIIDLGKIIENTSVKELIATLPNQIYILDFKTPVPFDFVIPHFKTKVIDNYTLEVDCLENQSISDVFIILKSLGLDVTSLRNKSNRLEELFLTLVKK